MTNQEFFELQLDTYRTLYKEASKGFERAVDIMNLELNRMEYYEDRIAEVEGALKDEAGT